MCRKKLPLMMLRHHLYSKMHQSFMANQKEKVKGKDGRKKERKLVTCHNVTPSTKIPNV